MKKLPTILFGLIVTLILTGCGPTNQLLQDGYYYKDIGGSSCQSYDVVTPGEIKCFDKDGKFTYSQNSMTEQEVLVWKVEEMESKVQSLQIQQMFNNINQNNNNNQQNNNNLYNNNNFITTCPWWDIC